MYQPAGRKTCSIRLNIHDNGLQAGRFSQPLNVFHLLATRGRNQDEIDKIIAAKLKKVIVDLSHLDLIDSSGVAALVKLCAAHGVPIVPQGGNSGMSGGATPDKTGNAVLLSLRRMNAIRTLDSEGRKITCDAGLVLQTLHDAAEKADLRFPLTLGGKGSATVGGLISTNAGGTQVLRHGSMRAMVAGIEAVLAELAGKPVRLDIALVARAAATPATPAAPAAPVAQAASLTPPNLTQTNTIATNDLFVVWPVASRSSRRRRSLWA